MWRTIRTNVRPSNNEPATAGIFLTDQFQSGRDVFEPLDEHVLQQIAEAGFDRALILRLDFDEVRPPRPSARPCRWR